MLYKNLQGEGVECRSTLVISPNPSKDDVIKISLKYPPDDPCHQGPTLPEIDPSLRSNIWVYDFYGNVKYESLETEKDIIIKDLKLTSGIYIVKRIDKYGDEITGKLIIK